MSLIDTTCSVLFPRRRRDDAAICLLAGYVLLVSWNEQQHAGRSHTHKE
jgi:hypothetical protein